MVNLLISLAALAQDPPNIPPDGWSEVPAVEVPGWVVTGDTWLRDGDACIPTHVEDAGRVFLDIELCHEGPLACFMRVGVADGWEPRGERCDLTDADGQRASVVSTHAAGYAGRRQLVAADDIVASWNTVHALEARVQFNHWASQTCDEPSQKALDKEAKRAVGRDLDATEAWFAERGIVDGRRRCDRAKGVVVHAVRADEVQFAAYGMVMATTDCRIACPGSEARATVAELRQHLEGRRYTRVEPRAGSTLYRTLEACRAGPGTDAQLPSDTCTTLGATL